MFVDKSLLIKGIAGVAAIGVGSTGFVYREEIGDMFRTKEQAERRKINGILGSLGIDCKLEESENPSTFTKECGLDEEKLGKIKFSNRGNGELSIVGNIPAELKLKIEGTKESISFSFTGLTDGSDLQLFGDKTKGKIVLKTDKKFKVEGGKLTKVSTSSDSTLKSQLEEFNKQLGSVNAPQECRFDEIEGETSVECSVTSDELKKIAFSNKGRGELTYSSDSSDFTGMKLKVNTHEEVVDSGDGTKGRVMYLTFKDYNKTVKLMDGKNELVSLIKGTNPEFKIAKKEESNDLVLEKMWKAEEFRFNGEFNFNCNIDEEKTQGECKLDDAVRTIKVKKTNGNDYEELTVTDKNSKFELHKDQEGFNQGYKFIFKGATVSGNYANLENDGIYEFKWKNESNTKIGYLSKKST